ncbi:MAG: CPBP family glutamic-type intramembrane protease [Terrisporobacter sp.]
MKNIKSIENKLTDNQYIIFAVIASILSGALIQIIVFKVFPNINIDLGINSLLDESIAFKVVFMCIVGPVIESGLIIFIIFILKLIHIKRRVYLLIITTIIFSLTHSYSLLYIITMLPSCFILIYSYLFYESKNLSNFKIMLYIHILNNTLALILNYL